jgi:hypothetical protein
MRLDRLSLSAVLKLSRISCLFVTDSESGGRPANKLVDWRLVSEMKRTSFEFEPSVVYFIVRLSYRWRPVVFL